MYTAMVAVWREIAYTDAGLEDEIEICTMSFYAAVVKSGIPWGQRMGLGWPRGMKPATLLTCHKSLGYNGIGIIMPDITIGLLS